MVETASDLIGATPKPAVRPVSLAVRSYLKEYCPTALVLAVSGGADSLALAVCALDQAQRLEVPALCVTVNHGLRPESAAEAEAVAEDLRRLGAKTVVASGSVSEGGGPEAGARELRYQQLAKVAREHFPVADILLGHTLDDQAETVLLGLGRGASAASLSGMRRRRADGPGIFRGRPLLGIRRAQTVDCCRALGLEPVNDPSNAASGPWRAADGSALRRAAVREWALPSLSRAIGQDTAPALARAATQMQEDDDALSGWARSVLASAESGEGHWAIDPLIGVPAAVRKRAIRQLAIDAGAAADSLSSVHIGHIDALVTDWHGQGPVDLPGGIRLARAGHEFTCC